MREYTDKINTINNFNKKKNWLTSNFWTKLKLFFSILHITLEQWSIRIPHSHISIRVLCISYSGSTTAPGKDSLLHLLHAPAPLHISVYNYEGEWHMNTEFDIVIVID